MTKEQEKTIKEIKDKERINCETYSTYGSSDICSLSIYESKKNTDDKNIVVKIVSITGISDNFEPYIGISNIMVEPNGHSFDMSSVFPNQYVMNYLQTLRQIN
jgi:hypothetical protein